MTSQLRSRSKRTEEGKKRFQNKCVLERAPPWRLLPYLAAGCFVRSTGRTGSVLPWKSLKQWETPINYLKCPTFDANRNAGDFQFQLIDSPKQMK